MLINKFSFFIVDFFCNTIFNIIFFITKSWNWNRGVQTVYITVAGTYLIFQVFPVCSHWENWPPTTTSSWFRRISATCKRAVRLLIGRSGLLVNRGGSAHDARDVAPKWPKLNSLLSGHEGADSPMCA